MWPPTKLKKNYSHRYLLNYRIEIINRFHFLSMYGYVVTLDLHKFEVDRINIMLPRMRPIRRTKYIASGGILGFCGFVTLIVMAIGGTGSDSSTTSSKYCILYPRSSNTREILSLDGLWQFSLADHGNFDGPSPSVSSS